MSAASLAHDALLPRAPGGTGAGAALAVLVHAGLLVALTTSIDWRSQPQEVVAAELWASVPQIAAPAPAPAPEPAPPAPPPAPTLRTQAPEREADIAIEQQKKRKAEEQRKKAEAEAERERERTETLNKKKEREKAEADKKKREQEARDAAAEEKRLAEQREANLRRMMGEAAQATTGTGRSGGTAAQDAAPSAAYAGRVAALIRRNSVFTGSVPGNPAAEVEVTAAASGTIIARRLVKSSGHKPWDDAVLQAIDKVGTLPRDTDGRVPSSMIIAFRPKE
jgi:colicin import membrane protein